jgi:O-methyltransferase involved in polyketide biosynthesis
MLGELLAHSSFDPAAPTCFVAEGLIHYLPRAAVERLFHTVAHSGPGPRRLLFSYIDSGVYAATTPLLNTLIRAVREVPVLHFDTGEITALCKGAGMNVSRIWSLKDQIRDFAPMAAARRQGLSQHLARADLG